jgi:pilus assembly protein CpaD
MVRKSVFLVAAILGGCAYPATHDDPARGVASVNVPVVTRADYVFDAQAPGGSFAPGEADRLNAWLAGLDVGYGDTIYVEGPYAPAAREQVASVVGNYGMLISAGAPVTSGMIAPESVRVVVSRNRAVVPNCPNWSRPSQPDFSNKQMSTFGCAVNSNIAAMIANPEDLIHGREGSGVGDALTANKAVDVYRRTAPTGSKGLQEIKKGNQ